MRRSALLFLLALCGTFAPRSDAYATSGWGKHSVDIDGRYRIHGWLDVSIVSRINGVGDLIDPPLIDSLRMAQYSVTSTHLVVRGHEESIVGANAQPSPPDEPAQRVYLAIRIQDGTVAGPMTVDEFAASPVGKGGTLHWKHPVSNTEAFQRFGRVVLVFVACFALASIALPILAYRALRRTKREAAADAMPHP